MLCVCVWCTDTAGSNPYHPAGCVGATACHTARGGDDTQQAAGSGWGDCSSSSSAAATAAATSLCHRWVEAAAGHLAAVLAEWPSIKHCSKHASAVACTLHSQNNQLLSLKWVANQVLTNRHSAQRAINTAIASWHQPLCCIVQHQQSPLHLLSIRCNLDGLLPAHPV